LNLEIIIQDKYIKLKRWIKEQKPSFLAYIVAFLLLGFTLQSKIFYILSMIIFAFALLYDISLFLKISHGKYWEKFIYLTFSVLAYFSYLHAEAFAKYSIYMETGVKADYFQTALAYFKGIYFVPSIILMISFLIAGALFVIFVLSFIPMFIDLLPSTLKEKLKSLKKQYIHFGLFLISALILLTSFFTDSSKLFESFFGKQFVASGILKYEFVPNRSCDNNISGGTLIKLLDGNNVLVSNIEKLPLLSIPEDENATFTLKKCKR
jgi:hypothetical protein